MQLFLTILFSTLAGGGVVWALFNNTDTDEKISLALLLVGVVGVMGAMVYYA